MTKYVIPSSEQDIPLQTELNVLGHYGVDRHALIWFVVNSIVNGANPMEEFASGLYETVEDIVYNTTQDPLQAQLNIDAAMTYVAVSAEHAVNRLIPYLETWLRYIADLEHRKSNRPIEFSVLKGVGQDVVIEVNHL